MVEATRGQQLSQFFSMPFWGWGPEPVGLPATMHLRICDLLDEWHRLDESGREARPELAEVMRVNGLDAVARDASFRKAMDYIRTNYPGYLENRSCSQPRTAAQEQLAGSIMRQALSAVIDADDPCP
mgnify:FL=1|jgi:hypothetical protein